jgi:hypothetical protein
MADKPRPKPLAGKGDNSRPFSDYKEFLGNFDEIPNFGFRPKWMKELDLKRKSPYTKDGSDKKPPS